MIIIKRKNHIGQLLLWFIIFLLVISFFTICVNNVEKGNMNEGRNNLIEAVKKTAIHCFSIEGQYPQDVKYLEDNYGLKYNHDKYVIHYQLIGFNIMPDIFVTERVKDD